VISNVRKKQLREGKSSTTKWSRIWGEVNQEQITRIDGPVFGGMTRRCYRLGDIFTKTAQRTVFLKFMETSWMNL
jgi:hypothetical protein